MAKKPSKKQTGLPFVNFLVSEEFLGKDGLWNPGKRRTSKIRCGFQINVMGGREHYLQLAEFLRRFAEKDTSHDGDYHEHFEDLRSADGNVRLHVIFRKDDVGDCSWGIWFPEKSKRPRQARGG